MRLKDKVVFVSGVGKGMGSATALLCAQEGARVALFARKRDIITPLAERITALTGRSALPIVGDATQEADVQQAVTQAVTQFGKLDAFLTFPGGGFKHEKDALVMDEAFFRMMLNNHLMSIFYGARAAAPHMQTVGGGALVTIAASEDVLRSGNVAYATVKEGVMGFTRNLARELHPHNIRVNCLSPGLIRLPLNEGTVSTPRLSLARRGQPEDIAFAALYLIADESAWITGQTLVVDGGVEVGGGLPRTFD